MLNSEKTFYSSQSFNNFQQLVHETINGYVVHPHTSPATQALFKKASKVAASVPTPNSKSSSKKVWDKFVTYAKNQSFDPMEASSNDIVPWLVKRSEKTASSAQVQLDLQALRCWRLHAGKPIGNITFETAVAKGLLHILEPL